MSVLLQVVKNNALGATLWPQQESHPCIDLKELPLTISKYTTNLLHSEHVM